jgi:hypothetical protein
MSSLVSQSIAKSEKGNAKPKPISAAGTTSVGQKMSLAAQAMAKAKKATPKPAQAEPASPPVKQARKPATVVLTPSPTAVPAPRYEEPVRTPQPAEPVSLGKPQRVRQETSPPRSRVYDEDMSDDDDDREEKFATPETVKGGSSARLRTEPSTSTSSGRKSMQDRTPKAEPKSHSRSKSGGRKVQQPSSPASESSFSIRNVVFRLACGVACAVLFYMLHHHFNNPVKLPQSIRQLEIATGESGSTIQYLDFQPSSDKEIDELKQFRDSLKMSLHNKFSDELTLEQLWETYQDMKQANGRMMSLLGMILGFAFAGVMM